MPAIRPRLAQTLRSTLTALALPAVALLVATLPLAAQEPPPEPDPAALPTAFGETVEVRVINIEVVVTDRDGVRVRDLERDEFRLFVDGEETPIDYFTEVRAGTAIAAGPDSEAVPAVRSGEPVGTSYLLFVDDFFSIARDRDRVLDSLADDLARLGPDDRLAVVAYDGRDLEMLTSWTREEREIRAALAAAAERAAYGLQRLAERRRYDLEEILEASGITIDTPNIGDSTVFDRLDPDERFYASQLADQVQRSVAAATATLRGFASPPGRKVALILSGGWPFLPAEFVVADFSRPIFVEPGVSRGEDIFRPLTDTANLLGYTLYPVDVPGLEAQTVDVATFSRPTNRLPRQSFLRENEQHYTLEYLAEKTGGRAFINAGRREALAGVVEDTRSYYWLGFTPDRRQDDQRHEIRVETTDPSLRVRSRSGFLDSSRRREVTMAVESSLLFGDPPGGEPLALRFGRPEKAGRGKMELPVTVVIPLDPLTLLPIGGGHVARVELRVAVIDEEGRQADVPVIPFEIKVEEEPPEGAFVGYDTKLQMRREEHRVVVSVYDTVSGKILSGAAEVSP